MTFKMRARDAAGRLGELKTQHGTIQTPALFPVVNPSKLTLTPSEIRELGAQCIMTNAYLIYKSSRLREQALEHGVHGALGFDGPIATDSGSYQLYRYGEVAVENTEIIEFQWRIGSDIATILDVPMSGDIAREDAKSGAEATVNRAREWSSARDRLEGPLWVGTAQGGPHLDIVSWCASELSKLGFQMYACGTLKKATEQYEYKPTIDYVITARSIFPWCSPMHLWGLGHPGAFALFAALGCDTFDSASYAIYARGSRYMLPERVLRLEDLTELPCSCSVCSKYTARELAEEEKPVREKLLAKHNLHVMLAEMRRVREAIRGGYLWELVIQRARGHSGLYQALRYLLESKYSWLEEHEPFSKRSGVRLISEEAYLRPDVRRAAEIIKSRSFKGSLAESPLGKVPAGLAYTFPVGHMDSDEPPQVDPYEQVSHTLVFQFGEGADSFLEREKLSYRFSKKTGMLRDVYYDGKRIGAFRYYDGHFIPSLEGARLIMRGVEPPSCRVVIKDEFEEAVASGTTVFTHFIEDCDPKIRPYQEAFAVNRGDELLAVVHTLLSASEVGGCERAAFARNRFHIKPFKPKLAV
ncbi:MAG: tRNA guanosine(15) transglycosylase TgtA [Thermoproteota archaeon]|nr:MAG: tRNA guanosine(15) transglycosylase TgtA [Candidatus Korarchaeota archaeon]RLG52801.1 MAG: tRNA guanosine(15) transglycosylase TgtA [Candidatus Korarchaeota archaeon]